MLTPSPATQSKPVLILGLGNPILGDDGVGWQVAEALQKQLGKDPGTRDLPPVEMDCLSIGGLSLMERMVGYDQVILIDAMQTRQAKPGTVSHFVLEEIPNRAWGHLTSSHDTTLHNSLQMGRKMGAHLPELILIVGIEAEHVYDFSDSLSPDVKTAVPTAVKQVIQLLASIRDQKERSCKEEHL